MPLSQLDFFALGDFLERPLPVAGRDRWTDGDIVLTVEIDAIVTYRAYRASCRRRRGTAQRRAMRLLKRHLTPEQRRQLGTAGSFRITVPSNRCYRIDPGMGTTTLVARHGKNWYATTRYCLHDARGPDQIPPADLALAHLLLLLADEEWFLRAANATRVDDQLWDRSYLARIRAARRRRAAHPA